MTVDEGDVSRRVKNETEGGEPS